MKTLSLAAFAVIFTCLVLQPIARADDDDKKKKKAAAEAAAKLQLQQQQMQINKQREAARRAAVARAAGQPAPAPVAPLQMPVVPGPGAAQGGPVKVQVQITNLTGAPLEAFLLQPDGSSQSFGFVQPGPDATPLQTGSGLVWVFTSNGRAVKRFTANAKPVQQWTVGGPGVPPRPVDSGTVPAQVTSIPTPADPQIQAFLQVHNAARNEVGVAPLRWSAELAAYAQEWANHLASMRNSQVFSGRGPHRPSQVDGRGENIAGGTSPGYSPADGARQWLSEKRAYRPGPYDGNPNVGHYTQMVWQNTTTVGYGIARSTDGWTYLVANYAPGGNFLGESPY